MNDQNYLNDLKNQVSKKIKKIPNQSILNEKLIPTNEMVTFYNWNYKLIEYNKDNYNKILFVNKFDIDEISGLKWQGWLFAFTDFQFKRFMNGGSQEEIPMFSTMVGAHSAFDIASYLKNSMNKVKVLDKGLVNAEANMFEANYIKDFQNSKLFKENDIINFKIKILSAANLIPLGVIFFPMIAKLTLRKG